MTGGETTPPKTSQTGERQSAPMKRRLFFFALAALIVITLWFGGLRDVLTLEQVQTHGAAIKDRAQAQPFLSMALFLLAYIVIVISCIPVVALSALFAGYLFGMWWGTALLLSGGTIGATVLFLLARSGIGRFLRDRASGFYAQVADRMENSAVSFLLFMRFVPLFPFFVANALPALFKIPLRVFLWTTFIGIIPSGLLYGFLGHSLSESLGESLNEVDSLSGLVSPPILAGMTGLALLSCAPILYKIFTKSAAKPGQNR